jgi:hypothetical protein
VYRIKYCESRLAYSRIQAVFQFSAHVIGKIPGGSGRIGGENDTLNVPHRQGQTNPSRIFWESYNGERPRRFQSTLAMDNKQLGG